MDFSQFSLESTESSKSKDNVVHIIPAEHRLASIRTRHEQELNAFMACSVVKAGELLTKTRLFTRPAEYKDISSVYAQSYASRVQDVIAMPAPDDDNVVYVYYKISHLWLLNQVSMRDMVGNDPELCLDVKEIRRWYLYILNCLTWFRQPLTLFVNIDDDAKLSAARDRVASGKFDLPSNEFTYMGMTLSKLEIGEVFSSTKLLGRSEAGKTSVVGNRNIPSTFTLPEVDMDGIEDRLYNLFVYLTNTQDLIGLDVETTGLDTLTTELVSFGIGVDTKIGFYLSTSHGMPKTKALYIGEKGVIRHVANMKLQGYPIKNATRYMNMYGSNAKNLSKDTVRDIISRLKSKKLILHNAKFDYGVLLSQTGIRLPVFMDTMLAHYISRPGYDDLSRDKRGLKHIAVQELEVPSWKVDLKQYKFEHKDLAAAYNVRDICYMLGMAFLMEFSLRKIWPLFEIEMKFLPVLIHAERTGICLDVKKLKQIEKDLKFKMEDIVNEFSLMYKEDEKFNINSGPMIKDLFFNRMGIVPIKKCRTCGKRHQYDDMKCHNEECDSYGVEDSAVMVYATPAGEPSLDKHALGALAKVGVTQAKRLMEYRAASKLVSSYTNLDTKVHPLDGMIHPTYNQARTATGRLCIAEGTPIEIVRDVSKYPKGIPIENVKEGDYAYCYDDKLQLTLKKVLWAGKTGVKNVIRVHWLGSGRHTRGHLDLTPAHEVRLVDGRYVSTANLTPGMRILALSRSTTSDYSRLHIFGNIECRDHRFILESLGINIESKHVHHKDGNKLNNELSNLEVMTHAEHTSMHAVEIIKNNPDRIERFRQQALKMWADGKATIRYGEDSSNYRKTSRRELIRLAAKSKGKIKFVEMDFDTYKKKCAENEVNDRAIHYRYSRSGVYISNCMLKEIISNTDKGKKIASDLELTKASIAGINRYFSNNHIVTRIEVLDSKVNVYDLEVEDVHNFIANELCVHNSSSNPNFQQLPKKAGKYIRGCIVPKPKHCLIAADYAGQEIRILAAYSKDEKLIRAYNPCYKCPYNKDPDWRNQFGKCEKESHKNGSICRVVDIHSYITKKIHGDAIDVDVSLIKDHPVYDRLRTIAKSVTFALAYGGSAYGIAETNGIPFEEAQAILDQYFDTFPGVKAYILSCQLYVDKYGKITDMVGRTRRFKYAGYLNKEKEEGFYERYYFSDGLRGVNKQFGSWVRKDRRAATNFPVQSLAASMTKVAAIELDNAIFESGIDAQIVQFIHDELLLTCYRDRASIEKALKLVNDSMTAKVEMARFNFPNHPLGWAWPPYLDMEADISIGDSYGNMMKPKEYLKVFDQVDEVLVEKTAEVDLVDAHEIV